MNMKRKMWNHVQALHCKVHLICVQLCATMKVICVQLTGRRAADQLSPLFPTFPPPPSHKNARTALTRQLLLLKFCLWPSLEASDRSLALLRLHMAGCSDNVVQSPLSSPSLAGWLSKERSRATVNSCSMYSCVTFSHSWSWFGLFFHFFSLSFLTFLYTFLHGSSWPVFTTFLHLAPAHITCWGIGDCS